MNKPFHFCGVTGLVEGRRELSAAIYGNPRPSG